jgi:maleylacetate reductase
MLAFVHQSHPTRVVFGAGTIACLGDEIARLGMRRVMILCTPSGKMQSYRIAIDLGDRAAGVFADATMHTPVAITEQAMRHLATLGVDGLVSLGGGSAIGLGKAIASRTGLEQIALPTTYAGSEMTQILGETGDGGKATRRDEKVRPATVIYDVELTMSLPVAVSTASGANAMAHAVEAMYAPDANPLVSLMAEEGLRVLADALPAISADPLDRAARFDALYGAWLCGACLGAVAMGLHHKLCHVLGGMFDLPHAETHAALLPHVVAFNQPAAPQAMARVARALGAADAGPSLDRLFDCLTLPRSLRQLGMPGEAIEAAADAATAAPYPNPRALDRDAIRDLIARAWAGDHVDADRATGLSGRAS